MKNLYSTILLLFFNYISFGQKYTVDSLKCTQELKFRFESLIIPTALIGYGIIGLESHTIKNINSDTKSEIGENIDEKLSLDDFTQYSPFISVYVLDACGINSKHNFKDRTVILASAYLVMGATINVLKQTGNEIRPDNSSNNSFPSGHTATAFMGAEFLYQEYKDQSIWYGVSGYMVAAGTGFFRMYNNRHWLTDVATGAGIGILSTKIAYWIHPVIKKRLFKDHDELNGVIVPVYNGKQYGLGFSLAF